MSEPSANTTCTIDRPGIDSERTLITPVEPLTAFSTTRVTSCSTCSESSPGASVWISAWAGTKSGNTSYLAVFKTRPP